MRGRAPRPPLALVPLSSAPVVRVSVRLAAARHQPGAGVTHRQAMFGVRLHGRVLHLGGRRPAAVPHRLPVQVRAVRQLARVDQPFGEHPLVDQIVLGRFAGRRASAAQTSSTSGSVRQLRPGAGGSASGPLPVLSGESHPRAEERRGVRNRLRRRLFRRRLGGLQPGRRAARRDPAGGRGAGDAAAAGPAPGQQADRRLGRIRAVSLVASSASTTSSGSATGGSGGAAKTLPTGSCLGRRHRASRRRSPARSPADRSRRSCPTAPPRVTSHAAAPGCRAGRQAGRRRTGPCAGRCRG